MTTKPFRSRRGGSVLALICLLATLVRAPLGAQPTATPTSGTFTELRNADLLDVVDLLARRLQINYVVDPAVRSAPVTVNTYGALDPEDLLPLLQTILRMNGATAVQVGDLYRVVPLESVPGVPITPVPEGAQLPEDERPVLNAIRFQHASAEELAAMLDPFLGPGSAYTVVPSTNTLVLLDTSRNMRRTMDLIGLFDTEELADRSLRFFTIENSLATVVASELELVFETLSPGGRHDAHQFVPLPRIGGLLAVSASEGDLQDVAEWIRKLDRPAATGGRRNFIYRAQYGEAQHLAATVQQLYSVSLGGQASALDADPADPLPEGVGALTESSIRIVADPINNVVLVQATQQEWEAIRGTLLELDSSPRQVLIDAKIYEVTLTGSLSSGVSAYLRNRSAAQSVGGVTGLQLAGGQASSLKTRKLAGSLTGAGLANLSVGMLVGSTRELALFLEGSESEGRTRVISAPSLIATDNIPAEIVVGQTIPTLASQAVVGGALSQGSSLFTNTVSNVQTGVRLSVTARVNASGIVTLRIMQEVSSPTGITGPIQSPTIDRRNVTTQVTVQDGDTVAIGGIMQETSTSASTRVPLLGRIPVVGRAFGTTRDSTAKTELIVLLEPHVIRDQNQIATATNELLGRLRALRRIVRNSEPVGEEDVAEE